MREIKKQVRGITLVALVVTIIVLLILSGVAISLTVGNNGLFRRAQNGADTWKRAELDEGQEINDFGDLYDETINDIGIEENENIPIVDCATFYEKTNNTISVKVKTISDENFKYYLYTRKEGENWTISQEKDNYEDNEEIYMVASDLLEYTYYDWYILGKNNEKKIKTN